MKVVVIIKIQTFDTCRCPDCVSIETFKSLRFVRHYRNLREALMDGRRELYELSRDLDSGRIESATVTYRIIGQSELVEGFVFDNTNCAFYQADTTTRPILA